MRCLLLASLAMLLACGAEDIVVANLEAGAASDAAVFEDAAPDASIIDARAPDTSTPTPTNDASLPCRDDAVCPAGTFCNKIGCDSPGVCTSRQLNCDNQVQPVCGCDGITYVNDCLRRREGVAAERAGACGREAVRCDPRRNQRCRDGAVCIRLVGWPNECAFDAPGACWNIGSCDGRDRFEQRFRVCDAPGCVDLCEAVRSDRSLILAQECRPP